MTQPTQAQMKRAGNSWEINMVINLLGLPPSEVTRDIERMIISLLKKNTINLTAHKVREILVSRGFLTPQIEETIGALKE